MKSIAARLNAAEKKLGAGSTRRGYTLEQLVLASYGHQVGPPARVLRKGEKSLEELLAECGPAVPNKSLA